MIYTHWCNMLDQWDYKVKAKKWSGDLVMGSHEVRTPFTTTKFNRLNRRHQNTLP